MLVPHRATYDMKLSGRAAQQRHRRGERPHGAGDRRGRATAGRSSSASSSPSCATTARSSRPIRASPATRRKDGLALRFSVRNIQDDEVEEELRGHADLEAPGGKGRATLHACPRRAASSCRPGTLFPTTHLALIIRHARDGDKSASYSVFDGARLDGAFQVNAVIGRPPRADRSAGGPRRRRAPAQPARVGRAPRLLRHRRPGRPSRVRVGARPAGQRHRPVHAARLR